MPTQVAILPKPISHRGALSVWAIAPEALVAVRAQLAHVAVRVNDTRHLPAFSSAPKQPARLMPVRGGVRGDKGRENASDDPALRAARAAEGLAVAAGATAAAVAKGSALDPRQVIATNVAAPPTPLTPPRHLPPPRHLWTRHKSAALTPPPSLYLSPRPLCTCSHSPRWHTAWSPRLPVHASTARRRCRRG